MRKFMVLICMLFVSGAYGQHDLLGKDVLREAGYPYRDKSGKFGYADDNLNIVIEPQYEKATVFTKQGFAVITDSLNRKGVIDRNNHIVVPTDYDYIRLFLLDNYTLAEVYKSYYTRWRFWEWEFLPGFSIMGGGRDNRLFDTAVKRFKKTVFVLGDKLHKVCSERLTDKSYVDKYFDIRTLDSNQVLIDDRLYSIGPKGARRIASGIKASLNPDAFAQQKKRRLHIIDRKGKRIDNKSYEVLDSILFKVVETQAMTVPLGKRSYGSIAAAYQSEDGRTFIYPDFSKPLPQIISEHRHPDDPTAAELIRGLWQLSSVPDSDYFLFMSFRDGKRFFRFLDTQGNWLQSLPAHIPFTIVRPSGDVIWSARKHYVPPMQDLEGWKISRVSATKHDSLYHITLSKAKEVRQGIWDAEEAQWLIAPHYYQVYTMANTQQWRFQETNGALWGIMDKEGTQLIEPTYTSIASDGWVRLTDNGEDISFYLHPTTLREFREK